jgi:hypothetical protein
VLAIPEKDKYKGFFDALTSKLFNQSIKGYLKNKGYPLFGGGMVLIFSELGPILQSDSRVIIKKNIFRL